jgi:hypothetical protein
MKTNARGVVRWASRLAAVALAGLAGAEEIREAQPLRLELTLTDGSRVIGTPEIETVPVETPYARMDIPLAQIASITMGDDRETATIDLQNGDKMKGVTTLKPLRMETIFGIVVVDVMHIRKLRVLMPLQALSETLRRGLVLHYSFYKDEGGKITDLSGKGNHGKVQGAQWTANRARGGAYVFDEKNDEITGSDLNLPAGDTARSVSFWFKLKEDQSLVSGSFVGWGTGQHNQTSSVGFDHRVNRYGVCFGQHGAVDVSSKKITQADEWHHVVFVYSGSGKTQFYVDNADHGLQADEIRSPIHTVPSGPLRLGASELKMQMGEFMIYDRALSAQEIDQIYELQKSSFAP